MKRNFIPLAIVALTISACSGGNSKEGIDEVIDIWYVPDHDKYYEVSSSGALTIYQCSLNDGYVIDDRMSGMLEDNAVTMIYDGIQSATSYRIENDGEMKRMVEDDFSIPFESVNEIPNACEGDAIEITYLSPKEVSEGMETEFLVNYDYRISSLESAHIGFYTTSNENSQTVIFYQQSDSALASGTGSGSLRAHATLSINNDTLPYRVYVGFLAVYDGNVMKAVLDSETINVLPGPL